MVHEIPYTSSEAMEHSIGQAEDVGAFHWRCPSETTVTHRKVSFEMDVSEEDFQKDFEKSMSRNIIRSSNCFESAPGFFVDSDDPYVVAVTNHILEETEGYSDYARVSAALNFVQTAIDYSYDEDTYGTNDYWATPVETLYLKKGDCEDTSVLLCSILIAMGYDCVLLDYPGHVAVGVWIGDETDYLYCETTHFLDLGECEDWCGENPKIVEPGHSNAVLYALDKGISGYRNLIWTVLGL